MRIVHTADWHAGFRQFDRMTPTGINAREQDVASSVNAVIDRTIALAPDLLLIAGDIFHTVHPPNTAIKHVYSQFVRLRAALPCTEIIMVAGNHDTSRTSEFGGILGLFRNLGLHVVDGAPSVIDLPQFNASVLAVPDNGHARPVLRPAGSRKYQVLLLHGETGGLSPKGSQGSTHEIPEGDLHPDRWDYIALGHYHVYHEVGPRAFYSGAIDYTATNPWGELAEECKGAIPGKGIVERDLATQSHTFHPLPRSREFVELPAISARHLPTAEIDALVAEAVAHCPGGIEGKVVRLQAHDLDLVTMRALDHRALTSYRRRALNFQLRRREVEVVRVGAPAAIATGVRRRPSLAELLGTALLERDLPPDLDRADFLALSTGYMAQAEANEARRVVVAPVSEETLAFAQVMANQPDPYESGDEATHALAVHAL